MRFHMKVLAYALGGLVAIPWPAMANATPANPASSTTLTRFVESVIESHPQVLAARAALDASSALRDAASRPLYNPELSLNGENASSDTRSVSLSQSIDWAGKRSARTAVAESDRAVVEAEYLATRWAVAVELLNGLALHQTGRDRDDLAASRGLLMEEFVMLAQRRFDAGDLAQVELDLAQLALTDARIRKATAAADLAEARQTVRAFTPDSALTDWPSLPEQLPDLSLAGRDPKALVLTLPDVLASRREVEVADAVVELRRRERRPDPTLSFAGGREDDASLVGLSLSLPLYVRNTFSAEVTAATADRSRAESLANDVLRRAYARLVGASERFELSRGAWRDWRRVGLSSLTRQTEQLRRLWEAGEISTTDYLVQLRQSLDVQESALDLRQALWRAWSEWLVASGQVDVWLAQGSAR